jgi:hypothetical protein
MPKSNRCFALVFPILWALGVSSGSAFAQATAHVEQSIDPALVDGYVGRYQLAPELIVTISREGEHFYAQATGQPRVEIFAEGERDFFAKALDAQLHFETDYLGKARFLVLRQNGVDRRGPRFEGAPVVTKVIAVDPKVLERYVGEYQLTPDIVVTVTRRDARLYARLTGQQGFEVFASAPQEFFYKEVDAKLTFEVDQKGKASAVILQQGGRQQRAPRIG